MFNGKLKSFRIRPGGGPPASLSFALVTQTKQVATCTAETNITIICSRTMKMTIKHTFILKNNCIGMAPQSSCVLWGHIECALVESKTISFLTPCSSNLVWGLNKVEAFLLNTLTTEKKILGGHQLLCGIFITSANTWRRKDPSLTLRSQVMFTGQGIRNNFSSIFKLQTEQICYGVNETQIHNKLHSTTNTKSLFRLEPHFKHKKIWTYQTQWVRNVCTENITLQCKARIFRCDQ